MEAPDGRRIKTLWIKRQNSPKKKKMNISDNQQPSGDKQLKLLSILVELQLHP
jgi:hypothetical protein